MTTRESDEIYQRRVYGVRVREPRATLVEASSESRANVGRCCCGRMVSLRCPKCKKTIRVKREPHDPPTAATILLECPKCSRSGGRDLVDYLDANGRAL